MTTDAEQMLYTPSYASIAGDTATPATTHLITSSGSFSSGVLPNAPTAALMAAGFMQLPLPSIMATAACACGPPASKAASRAAAPLSGVPHSSSLSACGWDDGCSSLRSSC